jgi:hypothetical protein
MRFTGKTSGPSCITTGKTGGATINIYEPKKVVKTTLAGYLGFAKLF